MVRLSDECIGLFGAIGVEEKRRLVSTNPLYSRGFFFCTGIVLMSDDGQAYLSHGRPRFVDIENGWPKEDIINARELMRREKLSMFALSTFPMDFEAIKKVADEEGVRLGGNYYAGTYDHIYDASRDDVVMKAEEKDMIVIPAERKVLVYREQACWPLEYRI